MSQPLNVAGSAVIDADGAATIALSPSGTVERWIIARMVVTASALDPGVTVYIGGTSPEDVIDGTDTTADHRSPAASIMSLRSRIASRGQTSP